MKLNLAKEITSIKGISKRVSEKLIEKSVVCLKDLLEYFPRRYEDRSSLLSIDEAVKTTQLNPDFIATIVGQCVEIKSFRFKNRQVKKYYFNKVDHKHEFVVTAFNPAQSFSLNEHYILSGKIKLANRMANYNSQAVELNLHEYEEFDQEAVESLNLGRIVPIYSRIKYFSQKKIRHLIRDLLLSLKDKEVEYIVPARIIKKHRFPSKLLALRGVHFPESFNELKSCRHPLIYEEFYNLHKIMLEIKKTNRKDKKPNRYTETHLLFPIIESLPFDLTSNQKVCLKEIIEDLKSPNVMNRMLQGDVGTGKTVVALLVMVFTYYSGAGSALMAPTEILARQHYQTFSKYLNPFDIKVCLITGSQSKKAREQVLLDLAEEEKIIVIGTHALIQKDVKFRNLKLIVVDEQHRFGVEQRKALELKGENKKSYPDVLSMSATPIPRSLFITFFGDLDASYLKEKPRVRTKELSKDGTVKRMNTKLLVGNRGHAYRFLFDRIKKGEQGYVVFPIIEESSKKNLKSLMEEYNKLTEFFKDINTSLIHGKLSNEEKEVIMQQYYSGEVKVLFATTVLEVGIDHPNATTIIIESAYQFGLSQLHQLRGRVGRGEKVGYCYLISEEDQSPETNERLEQFCELTDGFAIAELDLKLRGPGDLVGVRQSGLPPLKIGSLINDFDVLQQSRKDAEEVILSVGS